MTVERDAWLPVGYRLTDGATLKGVAHQGASWQIYETAGGGSALIVDDQLAKRWIITGLVDQPSLMDFSFGARRMSGVSCGASQILAPVAHCRSPRNKNEAQAFAIALKQTRTIDAETPLQDSIYVEKLSRLLPTYSITSKTSDDVVLGYWLTGGAHVSVRSERRFGQMMSWLSLDQVKELISSAGLSEHQSDTKSKTDSSTSKPNRHGPSGLFQLPGRPELESFFNEHVVDIIANRDRYRALGINFPSAIVLHGPPGCGKTFAVERLIDFLAWPSFAIDASAVASPYIHETSRKVAQVFEKAIESAPSVVVIDEMESFLADRDMGAGGSHHRVEEMAEFLRRIPEAAKRDVLIVAMTNRIDMIDPAILRRGRFDHVIGVGFPRADEVRALLDSLLSGLPKDVNVDAAPLAERLAGRPLSDAAFVVREGARLAARAGRGKLDQASLVAAMETAPAREKDGAGRRIGFI